MPGQVVGLSTRSGQPPSTCIVAPKGSGYEVTLAWQGLRPNYRLIGESLLVVTIDARGVRSQVASFNGSGQPRETPQQKAVLVRAAIAHPAEPCQVLQNGDLQLVPPR